MLVYVYLIGTRKSNDRTVITAYPILIYRHNKFQYFTFERQLSLYISYRDRQTLLVTNRSSNTALKRD